VTDSLKVVKGDVGSDKLYDQLIDVLNESKDDRVEMLAMLLRDTVGTILLTQQGYGERFRHLRLNEKIQIYSSYPANVFLNLISNDVPSEYLPIVWNTARPQILDIYTDSLQLIMDGVINGQGKSEGQDPEASEQG